MSAKKDLTGQRFGRLTVIKDSGKRTKYKNVIWMCKCDCGNTFYARGGDLGIGTLSCGCYKKEKTGQLRRTHGKSQTRLHGIWLGMKARCTNPNVDYYSCYGGRGIKVCKEWEQDFEAFYSWALTHGYSDDLTIDRINNDMDYSPDNCKWSNQKEQANNRRNSRLVTFDGKTQSVQMWADEIGIDSKLIYYRLSRGWSIEDALSTVKLHHGQRLYGRGKNINKEDL